MSEVPSLKAPKIASFSSNPTEYDESVCTALSFQTKCKQKSFVGFPALTSSPLSQRNMRINCKLVSGALHCTPISKIDGIVRIGGRFSIATSTLVVKDEDAGIIYVVRECDLFQILFLPTESTRCLSQPMYITVRLSSRRKELSCTHLPVPMSAAKLELASSTRRAHA